MTKRFENKIVAITGAAGGMGLAFARHLAAEGATLVLTDVDKAGLAEAAATLTKQGARCSTHVVDLAVENEIQKFAAEFAGQHERLDVLVNNAGLAYGEVAFAF